MVASKVNFNSYLPCLVSFPYFTSSTLDRPFSFYQGLYAGLGISQAVFTFTLYVLHFLFVPSDT